MLCVIHSGRPGNYGVGLRDPGLRSGGLPCSVGLDVVVKRPAVHGGQVYQAARALGCPVSSLVDFSASINPLGPPSSVLRAIQQALPACRYYPDPSGETLRQRLAKEHGISPDSIVLGSGSAELIRVLPQALSLRQGYVMGPTFVEYEEALHLASARCIPVPATSEEGYAPPVERLSLLLAAIDSGSRKNGPGRPNSSTAVFLCNPNSPTGRVVSVRHLRELYRQIEQAGHWMVVDEAFADFCPRHSLIKDVPNSTRLLILRSFTKFYGMPGIRLGYLAAPPDTVATVRRLLPPWSVGHLAQVAGVAAINDLPFRQRSVMFIKQERHRLMAKLRAVRGLRVIPSSANFLMVELPSQCVTEAVVTGLARQGMLVRDCRTFSGITQPALRLAICRPRDNNRLLHALREALRLNGEQKPVSG